MAVQQRFYRVPHSVWETPFAKHPVRRLIWSYLLSKKTREATYITGKQGALVTVPANSVAISMRQTAEYLEISHVTFHRHMEYFEQIGFVRLSTYGAHGTIVELLVSDGVVLSQPRELLCSG